MTNLEKIMLMTAYDMLCTINENAQSGLSGCVLDMVTGNEQDCRGDCTECISKWLNEEVDDNE